MIQQAFRLSHDSPSLPWGLPINIGNTAAQEYKEPQEVIQTFIRHSLCPREGDAKAMYRLDRTEQRGDDSGIEMG